VSRIPLPAPFPARAGGRASLDVRAALAGAFRHDGLLPMTRLYLTQREYDALLDAQGGKCCVRGCNETEGLIGEHSTPNAFKHGKPDQLMCVACHKVKTRCDVRAIAKTKRLNGATSSQYQRRKKFGSTMRGRRFEKRG
jgi:hypothetical protein